MSASPIEVVGEWLQNLLDPDVINRVVAADAVYVSLNPRTRSSTGSCRGPAFLEDSYATAASFRKEGSWVVQTEAGGDPFEVGAVESLTHQLTHANFQTSRPEAIEQ
jgi:hypothetical protein